MQNNGLFFYGAHKHERTKDILKMMLILSELNRMGEENCTSFHNFKQNWNPFQTEIAHLWDEQIETAAGIHFTLELIELAFKL